MLETRTPRVAPTEYRKVFSAQRRIGAWWKTSTKLRQRNGSGHRCEDSACVFVISAVRMMKKNGARNMTATTISSEWFATASRKRLRRTAAGTLRRTSG